MLSEIIDDYGSTRLTSDNNWLEFMSSNASNAAVPI